MKPFKNSTHICWGLPVDGHNLISVGPWLVRAINRNKKPAHICGLLSLLHRFWSSRFFLLRPSTHFLIVLQSLWWFCLVFIRRLTLLPSFRFFDYLMLWTQCERQFSPLILSDPSALLFTNPPHNLYSISSSLASRFLYRLPEVYGWLLSIVS